MDHHAHGGVLSGLIFVVVVGACAMAVGLWRRLGPGELQTLTFVTLVLGNQALLYVLRERRQMWRSRPSVWVFTAAAVDLAIVSTLALSGTLMAPLGWHLLVAVAAGGIGFAVLLDQVKRPILAAFQVE